MDLALDRIFTAVPITSLGPLAHRLWTGVTTQYIENKFQFVSYCVFLFDYFIALVFSNAEPLYFRQPIIIRHAPEALSTCRHSMLLENAIS